MNDTLMTDVWEVYGSFWRLSQQQSQQQCWAVIRKLIECKMNVLSVVSGLVSAFSSHVFIHSYLDICSLQIQILPNPKCGIGKLLVKIVGFQSTLDFRSTGEDYSTYTRCLHVVFCVLFSSLQHLVPRYIWHWNSILFFT